MSYGFQTLNGFNNILIDQNYTNLYLKEEGTLPFSGATPEDFATIGPPLNLTTDDLLFIQCDTAGIYVFKRGDLKLGVTGPAGIVRYRIYARTDSNVLPSSTGYGLEVYNAAEDLVFSSNLKAPRLTKKYYGQRPIIDSLESVTGSVWASVAGTEWFRMRQLSTFRRFDYQAVECYKSGSTSYFRPVMPSRSASGTNGTTTTNNSLARMLFIQD